MPNPLLPLSILTHRGRGGAYLTILLTFAGQFGLLLFLTVYLQRVQNFSRDFGRRRCRRPGRDRQPAG